MLKRILKRMLPLLFSQQNGVVLVQNPDDRAALVDLRNRKKTNSSYPRLWR